MASLSDPRVRAFLLEGTRTGMVAYTASDGRPLATPVWFTVQEGEIVFNTDKDSAKGRSIARDPRVTLTVDLPEPPYAFVQVQGEATVSEDPDDMVRTATAIARRYLGPERAEEFGRDSGAPGGLVVRIRPTKVIAAFDMTG